MIFLNQLLAGSVIDNVSSSSISSGYINIKGYKTESTTNTVGYSGDVYSGIDEILDSLGSQASYVTKTSAQTNPETGHTTYYITFTRPGSTYGGNLTIGSYDFTKYKKLFFTVYNYQGSGSVSFGSFSQEITAAKTYCIDIKSYQGNFNIKFSNNGINGYSVNNVYLEG